MSMEDDLFNVPENEEEMMDGNDDDDELDDNNNYGNPGDDDDNDGDNGDNDDDDDDDDGDGDNDDDDDEEGDNDGDDDDDDDDDDDNEQSNDIDNDNDNDIGNNNDNENEPDDEGREGNENLNGKGDDNDADDDSKFLDAKEDQDSSPISHHKHTRHEDDDKESGADTNDHQSSIDKNKEKVHFDVDDKEAQKDPDAMAVDDENGENVNGDNNENDKNNQAKSTEPPVPVRESIIEKAKLAEEFDIVPTMAIPYSSQCHAIAFTDGPKWILTGGEDGFIRKYDFMESIQGKAPLTMGQRHNMVDSITKSGIINGYWENEQPLTKKQVMASNPKIKASDFSTGSISYEPQVNPVYALEVERNGYWCLSGLLLGGISLYTMRYNEGTLQHYFRHGPKKRPIEAINGHNDAVAALKLNSSQDKFLSGAWDRAIRQWDLNTGDCVNLFKGSSGQISNIQYRPLGLSDLTLSYDQSITGGAEDEEKNSDMGSLFGDSDNENENEGKPKSDRHTSDDEDNKNHHQESQDKSTKPVIDNSRVTNKVYSNDNIFMSSCSDGTVNIWDVRTDSNPVIKYGVPEKTPPWCMSSTWSNCGDFIYVGRRNSTVDEFSIKMPHKRNMNNKSIFTPNILRRLQFPKISGPVTALSTMPNNNFLLCGSLDNIRLYNLKLYNSDDPTNVSTSRSSKKTQATPFLIVPGHHGGVLSTLYVDPTGRFMVSASGNRGLGNANSTDSVLVYEIDFDY